MPTSAATAAAQKILADMSVCQPSAALARAKQSGAWLLVDYETEGGLRGTMAFADPELGAPELTLPLDARGPHRIYVGINYTKTSYGDMMHYEEWSLYGQLEFRLSADPGFSRAAAEIAALDEGRYPPRMGSGKLINRSVQEAFWKIADVTGQSLHFRLPGPPYNGPELRDVANLTWVRLVPLTTDEEHRWRQDRVRTDTRRLAQIYCSGHLSGHIRGTRDYHPTSMDWFTSEIQPYRETDFRVFVFEAIRGGLCMFPTRHGDNGPDDNVWRREWVDPLAAFAQVGHEIGLEVLASLRMIGANYPMQKNPICRARHFFQHQEWVKRDKEGIPTTSWSLAYPEVRQFWLALAGEALERDIDGIVIYLHRFHPFVLYEEPTVASFKEKYGEDPRRLADDDPRWLVHSAEYLTGFLRDVRRLVDAKPGRKMGVTFFGCPTRYDKAMKDERDFGTTNYRRLPGGFDPLRYGCDVRTWIAERLADYYFPMSHADPDMLKGLRSLAGDGVHIWPDVMPRCQPPDEFVRTARRHYDAGADGLCFNDGERRVPRLSEWAIQRQLGHRDELDRLEEEAKSYYRREQLKTLWGYSTRYSFNNFG